MMEPRSTFETLEVWKAARTLRLEIANLVKTFPQEERYRLSDQMIRAARSVTANIAEGYGRYHYQENMKFCRQARGSLFELTDHLTVALDESYIPQSQFESLRQQTLHVVKVLNGYVSYLKEQKEKKIGE